MLYLGIDNHTIYGIIGTGRETVTAIKITPNTALFSGFWERPVLRKQTLRFQKPM